MERLEHYVRKSQALLNSSKNEFSANFTGLAQEVIPPKIIGDRETLHNADYRLLLYSWFVESICDLERIAPGTSKARLWTWVLKGLENHFPDEQIEEKLINTLTEDIHNKFAEITEKKRGNWKRATKEELISRTSKPVCWICDREFSKEAINNFLNVNKQNISLPSVVDYMFPRGVNERDLSIEIEHVVPFSLAGGDPDSIDNLELSCGWCNSSKSNTVSIYTTNRNGKYYDHPKLGKKPIPNRYWVVKLLMLNSKCQVCNSEPKIDKNKLRLTLINPKGGANINNLKVVCGNCDPMRGDRLVDRLSYKSRIINKKNTLI